MYAARNGHTEVVKLLLQHGVSPRTRNAVRVCLVAPPATAWR